jgi:prevent-host-death family protein
MIKVTTSEARKDFADVLKGARNGERFVLERHNKPVAAIVSPEDLAILQAIEDRSDVMAARAALAEVAEHGAVPWEKVKADLGL